MGERLRFAVGVVVVAACSRKSPPSQAQPEAGSKLPPAGVAVRVPCPKGIFYLRAWAHEVFQGCPPPQLPIEGVRCEGACPKPCKIHSETVIGAFDYAVTYGADSRWVSSIADGPNKTTCTYDERGRMKTCERPLDGESRIERDVEGRVSRVLDSKSEEVSSFRYDEHGRVAAIDDKTLGHSNLYYDAAGWLVREKTNVDVLVYHYDAQGNVTGYDAERGITLTDQYRYDTQGRLVETTTGSTRRRYEYDAKGRLVRYVEERTDRDPPEQSQLATIDYCD